MFIFGFIVGGLVFGAVGLLVGANNTKKVKAAANATEEKMRAELAELRAKVRF